jgi:transposase
MKRFAGIDIGSERHVVAVVDEHRGVLVKATPFGEEAAGYQRLVELLGSPQDCLVAMEATGHYWRNLFAYLVSAGFSVALLNPIRTRRFAEEELERTKTDAVDALGIARFAAQKDPPASQLAEEGLDELREVVRLRERLLQDCGDHLRQLHRAVDLSFPEFTRYVRSLNSELATALLARYPSAAALGKVSVKRLASLRYDGRHRVGETLAQELLDAAKISVGRHQSEPYQLRIRYACEDIVRLRQRLYELDADIARRLERHQVGKLLTTIEGIGPQTAACIIAELGDPARFGSVKALASYVGVIPRLRQSGKRRLSGRRMLPLGNARLRRALWMPTLSAIRVNPWLRAFYQRLRAAGKRPKVALIAVMHKLLAAIFSVARRRQPFVALRLFPPDGEAAAGGAVAGTGVALTAK